MVRSPPDIDCCENHQRMVPFNFVCLNRCVIDAFIGGLVAGSWGRCITIRYAAQVGSYRHPSARCGTTGQTYASPRIRREVPSEIKDTQFMSIVSTVYRHIL